MLAAAIASRRSLAVELMQHNYNIQQLAKQVAKGVNRSAFGLRSCSCVPLLLCSMTLPFNACNV